MISQRRHTARDPLFLRRFSGLLLCTIALQVSAVIVLIVVVMCESAFFSASESCHAVTLTALCCTVGDGVAVLGLAAAVSLLASAYASDRVKTVETRR